MNTMNKKFNFLSSARSCFDSVATHPEYRDYDRGYDDVKMRDAPAPFRVISYDETYESTKECPDHQHDCWMEGCGVTRSEGGNIGVCLIDADGVIWRDVGIVVRGGIGF